MIIAVTVAEIFVTGEGPFAGKGAPAFGALVPVALTRGGAAHDQLANFIIGDFTALFIDNLELVARHRLAGGAVAHVVRTVRQKRRRVHRRRTLAASARPAPAAAAR